MSTFPSASYDAWKLMSPDEEAERIFGPQDEDDFEEFTPDELDEALDNCCGCFDEDGVFVCGAVGSEECEFECPFNRDIGLTADDIAARDEAVETQSREGGT